MIDTTPFTVEEVVRDFVEHIRSQVCSSQNNYEENVSLMAVEITNNSTNDYFRPATAEEVEKLISRYMKKVEEDHTDHLDWLNQQSDRAATEE